MPSLYDNAGDIQIEFDNRILRGRYQVRDFSTGRRLLVYYNGRSESSPLTDDSQKMQLAVELFRRVVLSNYILMDQLDPSMPAAIREAAFRFANDFHDEQINTLDYYINDALVDSFGDQPVGSLAHQRVSWLCLNALRCVIPAWDAMCRSPAVEQAHQQLRGHLLGRPETVTWDILIHPLIPAREGRLITDCRFGMLDSIAGGMANAAKYILHGERRVAAEVLFDVLCAENEGAWLNKLITFRQWMVLVGLPAAFRCREPDCDATAADRETRAD